MLQTQIQYTDIQFSPIFFSKKEAYYHRVQADFGFGQVHIVWWLSYGQVEEKISVEPNIWYDFFRYKSWWTFTLSCADSKWYTWAPVPCVFIWGQVQAIIKAVLLIQLWQLSGLIIKAVLVIQLWQLSGFMIKVVLVIQLWQLSGFIIKAVLVIQLWQLSGFIIKAVLVIQLWQLSGFMFSHCAVLMIQNSNTMPIYYSHTVRICQRTSLKEKLTAGGGWEKLVISWLNILVKDAQQWELLFSNGSVAFGFFVCVELLLSDKCNMCVRLTTMKLTGLTAFHICMSVGLSDCLPWSWHADCLTLEQTNAAWFIWHMIAQWQPLHHFCVTAHENGSANRPVGRYSSKV